ncbi:hypothetical protein [Teredinibacter turnerae]|uniref:hypothetical protein n=1 Tax=Teredinibacter turnerae TaxID=2426 RepID=UPI0030D058E6
MAERTDAKCRVDDREQVEVAIAAWQKLSPAGKRVVLDEINRLSQASLSDPSASEPSPFHPEVGV